MARYAHLPIFIKTYELVKSVYRTVRQFPKEYKYSLGAEFERIVWEVLDGIVEANSLPDDEKRGRIEKISGIFDGFKIRFRFAHELGLIGDKKFETVQKNIEEIGTMIGGWGKWAENENRKEKCGYAQMARDCGGDMA